MVPILLFGRKIGAISVPIDNSSAVPDVFSRRQRGIAIESKQRLPFEETLAFIESKDARGRLADRGQGSDCEAVHVQLKVLPPEIRPWIEKADQLSRTRHDRSDITPFMTVAGKACVSEIVLARRAVMLLADDVVDLATKESILRVGETVFTEAIRP
jgi:hypothetical protein